jgi:hypothetical protein
MRKRQTLIVDASYDRASGRTGIGIAVHETDRPGRNGPLVDQIGECYTGIPPGHIEMFAVCRALEIGLDRGFKILKIRSDYYQMRKALKNSYEAGEGVHTTGLKGRVLRLTQRYESVQFGFKPRRKNQMAHGLARMAVREEEPISRPDLVDLWAEKGKEGEQDAVQDG